MENHPDGGTILSEMDDGLLSSKFRIKAVRIFVSHLMEKYGDRYETSNDVETFKILTFLAVAKCGLHTSEFLTDSISQLKAALHVLSLGGHHSDHIWLKELLACNYLKLLPVFY